MFDVGFSELVVIGVVALIVIGPERLPKVARTVGLLVGRLQRYVNDVKADINREMELDELRKIQTQFTDAAKEVETSVTTQINSAEQAINQSIAPVTEALDDASKAVAAPAADGTGMDAAIQAAADGIPAPAPAAEIPVPPAEHFNPVVAEPAPAAPDAAVGNPPQQAAKTGSA
ncbi:MAG: Sec-independent protein translocase protein TatB [Betaproteobacteria bacterium]|nr:Sec-independent protein translocase protein TatB [Pseudomonadota bacterium]